MVMSINNKATSKYEILAPAGSYKCMVAAFNAGADAVYLGGNMFGARANANNFSEEEIISAIEYAHIRGKKIFLTVNTLLKNNEIEQQLYDYIKPLYVAGLDAVIIQDLGVFEFVKKHFPDIDMHVSTQMTVTGKEFASKLKEDGATRIVPARELSLNEIKEIYDTTGLEIECFVHGALCYCYSGMCLFSSIIGGRSGNRGRCAQPCRLPYDIKFDNEYISSEYPLSPRDLCTLNILPDILEAGVYSLKIEGRMKKPEYVASVVSKYRKYVDMYEAYGRKGYKVEQKDIHDLMDIYNRGQFTEGYYNKHNSKDIMSVKRPNHNGTKAAQILDYNRQSGVIKVKVLEELHADDVLMIFSENGIEKDIELKSINARKGDVCTLKLSTTFKASLKDRFVMRTRNNRLIFDIEKAYINDDTISKVYIGGNVVICKDMPISIDVWKDNVYAHVEGDIPSIAQNRPVNMEDVRKQILKTGGTDFEFDNELLSITVDDGLFINIKELNSLRREALSQLKKLLCQPYERMLLSDDYSTANNPKTNAINNSKVISTVLVSKREQFDAVVESNRVQCVYIEAGMVKSDIEWNELITVAHNNKKEIYMALPYIFRTHGKKWLEEQIVFLKNNNLDGYLFRNMEEVCWFIANEIDSKKAVFDNTIYGFNNMAIESLKQYKPYMFTASYELNSRELDKIAASNLELNVYGYMPVMITAGCIKKTYNKCDGKRSITPIKDRIGNYFMTESCCEFCYNVIYNSKPTVLADILDGNAHNFMAYRYSFVTETGKEVQKILNEIYKQDLTRGHFKRGVE